MLDKYIIINRKPKIIIYTFLLITIILLVLSLQILYNVPYTFYYEHDANIIRDKNEYYLKLTIPITKFKIVTNNNNILIGKTKYNYQVINIDNNLTNNNEITIYLKINSLDKKYKYNNYSIEIKIEEENNTIINHFKKEV